MSQKPEWKILITEPMPLFDEEKKILEKYASVRLAKSSAESDLLAEVGDVNVIMVVYAKITRRIIDHAKKLKGIVRYGIGLDNIDIKAATKKGIPVANVPDYCVSTVADHTFALLLALTRKIMIADDIVRTGRWGIWASPSMELMGFDLEGKTLGLIGLGRIGKAVTKRAKGFGMKVLVSDPYLDKEVAKTLRVKIVDLNTLLRSSDIISVHSPLTPETHGLIGEKELHLMKKTAYIINTARGPLINEIALNKALRKGWIAGAGIDVYEKEPPDSKNPLLKLRNVVLTPHIAYYTKEAIRQLEMSAVDEAIQILSGEMPRNLVNKDVCHVLGNEMRPRACKRVKTNTGQ